MKIVNATPHNVALYAPEGVEHNEVTKHYVLLGGTMPITQYEPTGATLRCVCTEVQTGEVDGFPLFSSSYGEIQGLPEEKEGTIYIVSLIVAQAGKNLGRNDLVIPHRVVRDAAGRIIGCLGFAKL